MMSSRMPLTAEDLHFLSQVLGKISGSPVAIQTLIQDDSSLDLLLDHPSVKDALLDTTGCLRISPRFYFYILIRDVLQRGKIYSHQMCHYLSEILEQFSKINNLCDTGAEGTTNFAYLSDLWIALQKLPPAQAYQLRIHLGNYSLFMSGIFYERIEFQAKRRGAPSVRFYESLGSQAYRVAAETHIAKEDHVDHLLHELSHGFHDVRLALNEITEKKLHIHGYVYDINAGNSATP